MTQDWLYMRKIEVYVGDLYFTNNDMTIYFDVPFDDTDAPNIAEVKLYNLTDETIAKMSQGDKIIMNAGYDGDIGAILLGEVQFITTQWEGGVDKITVLQCLDGSDDWFKLPIQKTYAEGITGSEILADLMAMTGLQFGAIDLPNDVMYDGGKTFKTTLRKAIADVASDCGAKAFVTRGKLFIRPAGSGDDIKFIIDADHGLIESPQSIQKNTDANGNFTTSRAGQNTSNVSRETSDDVLHGYSIKTLLNHRVTTYSVFEIHSKTANGLFYTERGKHTTDGSTFYTELEVYPPK